MAVVYAIVVTVAVGYADPLTIFYLLSFAAVTVVDGFRTDFLKTGAQSHATH